MPKVKSKVALKDKITLLFPTGEIDEETGEEIRKERSYSVRWNKKALFRMSAAGYEKPEENRDFAFMVTLAWAVIDTDGRRPSAEDIADAIPDDKEQAEKIFATVLKLIEASDTGKKT